MTEENKLIATRIFQLVNKKYSQEKDFAKEIGVKPSALSDWKSEKTSSFMKIIPKIADCLDVSVDYLLGRTDDPTPISSLHIPETVANVPLAFSDGLEGLSQESLDDIAKYIEFVKQRDANKNK